MSSSPAVASAPGFSPSELARHYRHFRVSERVLLTGHSHQAWPDCSMAAQQQAWTDAAELLDRKWERALVQADKVRQGFARLLGDAPERIALGQNTHELVVRFLSALPLRERPLLLSSDGEFHSLRRQLDRLAEEAGIEILRLPSQPATTLAERLAEAVDSRCAAVLVSAVLYANAHRVPHLDVLARRCREQGVALLVDAYHAINALPFALSEQGLEEAYVVGGGYKYCQLGEGCAFLRVPPGCELRPVITGWFAEFDALSEAPGSRVQYGAGASRFAGATYDPCSHYRAAAVFDFFCDQGLSPERLRVISQHQLALQVSEFDALDLNPQLIRRDHGTPLQQLGGFLTLETERAAEICQQLAQRQVYCDHRGKLLRLGPAPYVSDEQLRQGINELAGVCRRLAKH